MLKNKGSHKCCIGYFWSFHELRLFQNWVAKPRGEVIPSSYWPKPNPLLYSLISCAEWNAPCRESWMSIQGKSFSKSTYVFKLKAWKLSTSILWLELITLSITLTLCMILLNFSRWARLSYGSIKSRTWSRTAGEKKVLAVFPRVWNGTDIMMITLVYPEQTLCTRVCKQTADFYRPVSRFPPPFAGSGAFKGMLRPSLLLAFAM